MCFPLVIANKAHPLLKTTFRPESFGSSRYTESEMQKANTVEALSERKTKMASDKTFQQRTLTEEELENTPMYICTVKPIHLAQLR